MRELPFSLGPRLRQCAAFVRPGSRMADIGTDHGYLPCLLYTSYMVQKVHIWPLSISPMGTL